jgi:hypothetical protein
MTRKIAGRYVRMVGHAIAAILVAIAVAPLFLGREFAVFYLLFAILASGAGDFVAVMLEEGASGLRPRKHLPGRASTIEGSVANFHPSAPR